MKKALIYATVASMIDLFNMDNIKQLQELGYQVDVAANFEEGNVTSKERISQFKNELDEMNVKYHHIPIPRSIGKVKELIKSYNLTKKLKNNNKYDLVHCHTPIGSAICRIAFRNSEARVIYTAHGFHFYKGAPYKNWLIYYPVEFILSNFTDTLITINHEDYNNAKFFKVKNNHYIPGIGIDLQKYATQKNGYDNFLRKQLKLKDSDIIIFSTGELNENKNHEVVIRAIAKLKNKSIHYIIAGKGPLKQYLEGLSEKLQVTNQVHLLGYRSDISELLALIDIFVFPSLREGLSVSLMEAMATEKPIIASNIRGNSDLIANNHGGYLFNPTDSNELMYIIEKMLNKPHLMKSFGKYNGVKVKKYSSDVVNKKMNIIYNYLN